MGLYSQRDEECVGDTSIVNRYGKCCYCQHILASPRSPQYCSELCREKNLLKKRKFYWEHRIKIREYQKKYRLANKDSEEWKNRALRRYNRVKNTEKYKERCRVYQRKWLLARKNSNEYIIQRRLKRKIWRQRNIVQARAAARVYYQKNKEKIKEINKRSNLKNQVNVSARRRRYALSHKIYLKEYQKTYRQKHDLYARYKEHRRVYRERKKDELGWRLCKRNKGEGASGAGVKLAPNQNAPLSGG